MSVSNCPETPRQRMISMMYIFLTAMLALNVSADILRGFTLVNQSLDKSLATISRKNDGTFDQFKDLYKLNPTKVGESFRHASAIRVEADSLVNFIEDLKVQIVRTADGRHFRPVEMNGRLFVSPDSIGNRDNLDVAGQIMVPNTPTAPRNGAILRQRLTRFREQITFDGYTEQQKQSIARLFDTSNKGTENWETQMFQMMPVAGAVTILTQLQNSIRSTEGDALEYLKNLVDATDFRVNSIEAFIIPESKYIVKGGQFQAQIGISAVDTTQVPVVKIGGQVIPDGKLVRGATAVGTFPVSGVVQFTRRDGSVTELPFKTEYIVGEPSVTISADMMNVFYAGIDNPVSISVPGVPMSQITARMEGGQLLRTNNGWNAKPATVGVPCVISVTATINGRTINFGSKSFRTKPLPPPVAFIEYKDGTGIAQRYKGDGGKKIKKQDLLNSNGVRAALDDPDLDNIPFSVTSFEVNFTDPMGNTIVDRSDGNRFTEHQLAQMRQLAPGRQFFITRTKAIGPDKISRELPPIQVILQ